MAPGDREGVDVTSIPPDVHFELDQYGFEWGSAHVQRIASDEKRGWVVIDIRTPKAALQVYVTKTGRMRLTDALTRKEIKP